MKGDEKCRNLVWKVRGHSNSSAT